ncbi:HNH endonuclease [Undibacterium sp. Ji50W]|uniref:HNH endonuclease n=1 Tax=Undibacterium sp. Ji50W TaxID=3413041 RepID=UPI003BF0A3AE
MSLKQLFDNSGCKKVSFTDKEKHAYVPNQEQKRTLEAAGIFPSVNSPHRLIAIKILNESGRTVSMSYYNSLRLTDPNRPPEARIGLAFITEWLNEGDNVLIGNIGNEIFAMKLDNSGTDSELVEKQIASCADANTIFNKAKLARGTPKRKRIERLDFVRNPYVVRAALLRANGQCEMPSCREVPFHRDDNSIYLEVHHIVSLSEEGNDSLDNVAALCPNCHRELHFGINRIIKKNEILDYLNILRL